MDFDPAYCDYLTQRGATTMSKQNLIVIVFAAILLTACAATAPSPTVTAAPTETPVPTPTPTKTPVPPPTETPTRAETPTPAVLTPERPLAELIPADYPYRERLLKIMEEQFQQEGGLLKDKGNYGFKCVAAQNIVQHKPPLQLPGGYEVSHTIPCQYIDASGKEQIISFPVFAFNVEAKTFWILGHKQKDESNTPPDQLVPIMQQVADYVVGRWLH